MMPADTKPKALTDEQRDLIKDLYKRATPNEKILINHMLELFETEDHVINFFLGAHIELHGDNGEHYKAWAELFSKQTIAESNRGLKNRSSSHDSLHKQYSISGNVISEALFGTRLKNKNDLESEIYTWIQLERHPVAETRQIIRSSSREILTGLGNFVMHAVDYIDYSWTGQNIGPLGRTDFTEANPLIIHVNIISQEEKAQRQELWLAEFFDHLEDPAAGIERSLSRLTI
jgi:hypothetical protein